MPVSAAAAKGPVKKTGEEQVKNRDSPIACPLINLAITLGDNNECASSVFLPLGKLALAKGHQQKNTPF
jgi:hypothetical protein